MKVATEIVRQQDMFGLWHRAFATAQSRDNRRSHQDARSTVSRVTAGKYMMTDRGLFEMKYFFTSAISSNLGEDAHSAESVRLTRYGK
ncbi:MAG: hypothetical protein R3D29_16380 [Nitratireductor sp.]